MSCISSNFSSFFLDSLNDPSEFAKYLGNGENKVQTFDDFQVFGGGSGSGNIFNSQLQYNTMNGVGTSATGGVQYSNGNGIGISNNNNNVGGATNGDHEMYNSSSGGGVTSNEHINPQQQHHPQHYAGSSHPGHHSNFNNNHHHQQQQQQSQQMYTNHSHVRWNSAQQPATPSIASGDNHNLHHQQQNTATGTVTTTPAGNQHFDGSFEFLKYLRHTSEYSDDGSVGSSSGTVAPTTPGTISNPNPNSSNSHNSLIDLDSSTSMKSRSVGGIRKAGAILTAAATPTAIINSSSLDIDSFDHDSKHTIFDLQQQTTNSNSNESSCAGDTMFSGTFASNASNTSSEGVGGVGAGSDNSNQNTTASKPLASFSIKDNFDVSPAHRVEEGIFQHMNKLPPKKKETLKQLGVRFTGQMTLADKSIVVENFIKFCQEYDVTDHRPFLSLNQSGLNKPEQIKFARYLGQGLPLFTLFCIYSNFKNLFCTKRTETYVKDGYNLNYILEKTKRHLSCTTAGGTPIKPSQTTTTMQIGTPN